MDSDGKGYFSAIVKRVFDNTDSTVLRKLSVPRGRAKRGRSNTGAATTTTNTTEMRSGVTNRPPHFVFTREWRVAFIRNAAEMPMNLLLQEFNYRYNQLIDYRHADFGGNSNGNWNDRLRSKEEEVAAEPEMEEDDNAVPPLPPDCIEMVLLKLQLFDLLRSRFVCHQWANIFYSENLTKKYEEQRTMESCIVLNNSGLDFWAFSVVSMRWFCMNGIRCDSWDHKSVKTLGLKAASSGLFLVAASDLTLYVVNPLTKRCRRLPSILGSSTPTRGMKKLTEDLLKHGAIMMENDRSSGEFGIYLIEDDEDEGNRYLQINVYYSTTDAWTKIRVYENMPGPNIFPPRSVFNTVPDTFYCIISIRPRDILLCFLVSRGPDLVIRNISTPLPRGMLTEDKEPGVGLPTTVLVRSEIMMVGRIQKTEEEEELYGRLPLICHSVLGLWQIVIDERSMYWKFLDATPYELMEELVKSSEGTDILITGDGDNMLWFMVRGSPKILAYNINDSEWTLLHGGCPGSDYMDAHMPWKAVYGPLTFRDNL